MKHIRSKIPYLLRPFPVHFLLGLLVVNIVAALNFNPYYIGSFFAFFYILIMPGFLLLPFLTERKLPPMLGIALSVALSAFMLMIVGLGLNTFLPMFGMLEPLTTLTLLIAFDVLVYILLFLNFEFGKSSPFEFHKFDYVNWLIVGTAVLLPVLACLGSIILNNGGSNILTMIALAIIPVLIPVTLFNKRVNPSTRPIVLYAAALSLLLMNSMRGWFITGHDILLEYHVFTLTNDAHRWMMSVYQDPYNACLSLTILPTYLVNLIHSSPAYIFKFFYQFIGALPVVLVYYLAKEHVSERVAFLVGFLYLAFPTFMIDMAFLNRQGIAFLFFGSIIFTVLYDDYFSGKTRMVMLFMFGAGMIISHYSTSYIAVPLLIGAYILNRIARWLVSFTRPKWFFKLINRVGNLNMYQRPILLSLPFVLGLLGMMILWSTVITKTSKSFMNTIEQIVVSLKDPFHLEDQTGPARYSLMGSVQQTPEELFKQFVDDGIKNQKVADNQSKFYPLEFTQSYQAKPALELPGPLTDLGERVQAVSHLDLSSFYNNIKFLYAKILQVLVMFGVIGLVLGYSFKKNILRDIPIEYIAIAISGIAVMVGQTVLPSSVINYGLLRLFQQNLLFLSLPIFLALLVAASWITRDHIKQLWICTVALLFFFIFLSGLVPQLTGGGRPLLHLNNSGLYYDSYYMHAEEVASSEWLARNNSTHLPIQAAHFSDIKMTAYGRISAYIELLPETTKKNSYVYLNYDNVKTSNILEIIYGDVVYYHFPMQFLHDVKDLVYSNGGSQIYR